MSGITLGTAIGDWIVEDQLGTGGMGAVYRCRNAHAGRLTAAIKVLRGDDRPDFERWFRREVEALAALRHPGIVRVLGAGVDPKHGAFLAMDLVEGVTLREHVRDHGPLPAGEARKVLPLLTSALAHAHARGVRHRDIKPGNVILTPDGLPVLVDFGIARLSDATELTVHDALIGTPAYMSPEMFDNDEIDLVAADVYALGVVLWEALTGKRAFTTDRGLSSRQRMVKVAQLKWQSAALDPGEGLPQALRDIIGLMTSPDPKLRPSDLSLMATQMEQALRDVADTVTAAPITMEVPRDATAEASIAPRSEQLSRSMQRTRSEQHPEDLVRSDGPSAEAVEQEVYRWVIGAAIAAIVLGGIAAVAAGWWVGLI